MSKFTTLEEVITVASKMKEQLQGIHNIYEQMPRLIKKEHAAIKASKIEEVEAIALEKTTLGDKADALFAELRRHAERLVEIYKKVCERPENEITSANISDCISLFEEIAATYRKKGFGGEVFEHVLRGFKEVFRKFVELKKEARPIVERNKYVLSRLIQQRQENYRFWQEVAMETMANYNKEGRQKAKPASILSIKA